jgi:hypothetical protein
MVNRKNHEMRIALVQMDCYLLLAKIELCQVRTARMALHTLRGEDQNLVFDDHYWVCK